MIPVKKPQPTTAAQNKETLMSTLRDPRIRGLLTLAAVTSMFGFQYGVLLPIIADKMVGGGAASMSILSAAGGVGALCGALFLARTGKSMWLLKAHRRSCFDARRLHFGDRHLALACADSSGCGVCRSVRKHPVLRRQFARAADCPG